jgi:hypothetical protein
MIGRTMESVVGKVGDDELVFVAEDGAKFRFFYEEDCCASCTINDIAGDIPDLIGSPILQAELISTKSGDEDSNPDDKPSRHSDSWTWSFYKFRTNKGDVTISWLGESNGYYNESVSYEEKV